MSLITRPEIIVHFFPHRLVVGKVRVGRHTFLMERSESEWDENTLPEIFTEIKNTFRTETIRILLDDALCHTITVDLPQKTVDMRDYLRQQIETRIGESPGPQEWDYKKATFPLGKKDKAIVFVPHQNLLKAVTTAANRAELTITAMEPVKIAQKRNEDPMIGLAIKEDLNGLDEEILNISVQNSTPRSHQGLYILVLLIILVIIITVFGFLGFLAYKNFFVNDQSSNDISITAPVTETVQPEASPTPEAVPEANLADYKIQVLNGSGITGKAGDLKAKLTNAGFIEVNTGNATRFDYTGVSLQTKVGTPQKITETIIPLLDTTPTNPGETLSTDSPYDVVIILGQWPHPSQSQSRV